VGKSERSQELLALGEYNLLEQALLQNGREPSDLLGSESNEIIDQIRGLIDSERIQRLLGRGFLLSQAVERWQARSIWVVSREEQDYPERVKVRLKGAAPAVFYGCGDAAILKTGGLAIVGSRHVDAELIEHTESIGRLAARADKTVISGGARGIDQAAMRGALQAEGRVIGALADSLEQLALNRDSREYLMNKQLVLISAYDPSAGFNVGNAMNRNKIIYSLADAALVVSADYESGGTWAGANEQLAKLRFVPIYVRSEGVIGKGLTALLRKGARPWPNPSNPDGLERILASKASPAGVTLEQSELPLTTSPDFSVISESSLPFATKRETPFIDTLTTSRNLADELFEKVRELLREIKTPKTIDEVAVELDVSKIQAREWLQRLVNEGTFQKTNKPVRFSPMLSSQKNMFKKEH
jgi:predicted Rossmann fold nucleotide-binding protein DprA/Smf involved in DNA uptake